MTLSFAEDGDFILCVYIKCVYEKWQTCFPQAEFVKKETKKFW